MPAPFRIKSTLATSSNVDPDDVLRTKRALHTLGFYKPPKWGITEIPDRDLFDGIAAFQKRHGLQIDGVVKPGGPTEKAIESSLPASSPGAVGKRPVAAPVMYRKRSYSGDPTSTEGAGMRDPFTGWGPIGGGVPRGGVSAGDVFRRIFGAEEDEEKKNRHARSGRESPSLLEQAPPPRPLPGFEPPDLPDEPNEDLVLPEIQPLDLGGPIRIPKKPSIFITPPIPHRAEDDIFEGRRGKDLTKAEIDRIRNFILDQHPDWEHVKGGRRRDTNKTLGEYWVPSPAKDFGGDGRRGGNFVDLTFETPDGKTVHVQHVDIDKNGKPTQQELDAADNIRRRTGDTVILIPKEWQKK